MAEMSLLRRRKIEDMTIYYQVPESVTQGGVVDCERTIGGRAAFPRHFNLLSLPYNT